MRKPSVSASHEPVGLELAQYLGKIRDRHIEVACDGAGRELLGDDTGVASLVGVQPREGGEERGHALCRIAASDARWTARA